MGKYSNLSERWKAYMLKHELSKARRIASMRVRLCVDFGGFKSYYEDL